MAVLQETVARRRRDRTAPHDFVVLRFWEHSVSRELNRKKHCKREVGSCSRKLDLNHPVNYVVDQSHVIDVDKSHGHSKGVDEHGILNKQTKTIGNDIVHEELEVIQSDDCRFVGFHEDERKRMLKEMSKSTTCSHGEIYLKPCRVGQSFKTKKEDKGEIWRCCGWCPSTRSKVKCKGKNRPNENQDWLVKTVQDAHKCLQTGSVKACTSKYLANLIVPQIHSNPRIPIKALHEELCNKLELGMSTQKVARAKQMVECVISGDYQLQYGYLRNYASELQNTNPGTTVRIDVYPEACLSTTTRTFRRIYVCLCALKLGFKFGLRDFLGVDGEDLEFGANSNFTFISDRQRGIIPAIANVLPNAKHRFCLRHIQENMKKQWKGKELIVKVWEYGKATTLNHFKYAMDDLKKINDEAHSWLCKIPAKTWSKSHLNGRAHTDYLLNNLCEVFKAKIDEGKDKPIITCLEYIREYLMKRICVVQKEIDKCQWELSTTATIILEEIKIEAAK
uniref:MULE transposase domain-containing protein n=1 Tax=Lactuca sativa TaxID=4236 RepID=A0A9R1VPQ1_LACSA|nr:hypothetical protein LSAT_V11C400187450 [Lactuca sativa]